MATAEDRQIPNEACRALLRRVGAVLLAVGLIDLGFLLYCVLTWTSYSSSLIFALIPGVSFLRGRLWAVRWTRIFAAFMGVAFLAVAIAMPLLVPVGLMAAYVREASFGLMTATLLLPLVVALAWWVVRELGREEVQDALTAAGKKRSGLRLPVFTGLALVLVLVVTVGGMNRTESAEKARRLAADALGSGYEFHVTTMRFLRHDGKTRVSGTVAAWNDSELVEWPFQWIETR